MSDYDSFSRPYVGKAVDGFYEYLKENNIKYKGRGIQSLYYAKFCSIVQSSGTGKSRVLTELRNKGVLVLYMNIRERSDAGFPKRDAVPARILTEDMNCSEAEYAARCCVLFAAIFQALRQELLLRSSSGITSWNDDMCDMGSEVRTKFFHQVQSIYAQTPDKIKQINSEKYADAEQTSKKRKISNQKVEPLKTKNDVPAPKFNWESFVKEAYEKMLTAMSGMFTETDEDPSDYPKLVISFDEAHSLSKMSSKGFRPSHILGRAINCYSKDTDRSIWVVFASTTPHVVDLPAPQVIRKHPFFVIRLQSSHKLADNSMQIAVGGHLLFPPYTHLGWDQNADRLSDISASDVGKFDHIVGFGRPLFIPVFLSLRVQFR
ncbi:hypothetical protein DEU56DRAFT_911465 [Suillus clintonianus]|uniref:uncharacterized protein n=1 Tax=Suillus clintonianus TaxID=1904413 RepID=UPI001B8635DD|nr:uncharacterized protein DEU56DRAFT_911465 [Suillus clintonianus]KAG2141359.1 hypothetical protein DEU56DRAFT_911465 [Suillus clintonianus]